jgi:vacuolar-type H+-ATPase subunit E/Vma4
LPDAETNVGRLTEEVLADARRKAQRRLTAAQREAEALIAAARARAQEEAALVTDAARERGDRHRQRILATISQETQRRRLIQQGALLEGLIQAGSDRAADRKGHDPREVLKALVILAIEQIDGEAFHLEVSAADRDVADEAFLAEVRQHFATGGREPPALTLEAEPAGITGGVIVRSADGHEMVDNSFEARRRRLASDLRRALAQMIFPEPTEAR